MSLAITPETRLGELLATYPALEAVLIAMAPPFAKLRNPMLRKTVAKVATVAQAARIGGVDLREMVAQLRAAAGQDAVEVAAHDGGAAAAPEWLRPGLVAVTIDADRMLEGGEHPVGKVRQSAAALPPGGIVRLDSSFRPEPLIELMRREGLDVFSRETAPGRHATYFRRSA